MKKFLYVLVFFVSIFVYGQEKQKTTLPESKTLFSGKIIVNAGASSESVQERLIQGTVTDKNNEPLNGVAILINKTYKGMHTDFEGKYSIAAKPTDTLVFSYPGFKTQKIKAEKKELNINMEEDIIIEIVPPFFNPKNNRSLLIDPRNNVTEKEIENVNNSILSTQEYSFIIGKWREIEYHGNDGADDYIDKIENGRVLTFEKNGNVWIEKETIVSLGSFEISLHDKHSHRLYITYENKGFYYLISNQENPDYIYLTPVTSDYQFICKEGCSYVYEKIK